MKKLLVLNGSHSDIQLIQAGKKLGYYVYTTGNRPDLIGHAYADEYICGDFSKPEEIYELFKDKELDAVCSCANDFGAITASYLSDRLGLPGHDPYETTLILHHKDKFKRFSAEHDIHTPRAVNFQSIDEALSYKERHYPMIVKPIDLTGGKGISRADSDEEYEAAVRNAFERSPKKRIVAEPFIVGTQHSFSTFLVDRKVAAYFSDNEYSYLNPYLVSTSGGPATNVDKAKKILIDDAEKIASLLDLRDGVFHYQYLLSEDGTPHILEITRRCSGDWYSEPVEHATGIPWAEWIVRSECGLPCDDFPKNAVQKGFCGRHCIMGDRNGTVKGLYISDEIRPYIYDSIQWWKPGYRIDNYMSDKIGILFLEYENEEQMLDIVSRITDLVQIEYE
ncbi:MAG: ATP-grasp domain-containing protein [Ruminococcus sp.]|nr:ATP-grasp domain-containing protein [Ruminococcus sp.]